MFWATPKSCSRRKPPSKKTGKLRLVRFHDKEQDRDFAFLTNAFGLPALKVAGLYRSRWQVELFFKWLKQHLRIRKFWGTTESAVRIQVGVAIAVFASWRLCARNLESGDPPTRCSRYSASP